MINQATCKIGVDTVHIVYDAVRRIAKVTIESLTETREKTMMIHNEYIDAFCDAMNYGIGFYFHETGKVARVVYNRKSYG